MAKRYYREAAEQEYARAYKRGRKLLRYSDDPAPAVVEFAGSRYFRKVQWVADFACGEGIDAVFMAERGKKVVGFDIVPAAVRKARAHAYRAEQKAAWLVGDTVDSPLKSDCFQLVLAISCFGRLLEDAHRNGFLRETFRVLKPGGFLLFSDGVLLEEVRESFPDVMKELAQKRPADLEEWLQEEAEGRYEPPSQRYETRAGYERMLERTGYRIIHSHLDVSAHAWGIVLWARKPIDALK
jgi:SAM-dependent methyltransferase